MHCPVTSWPKRSGQFLFLNVQAFGTAQRPCKDAATGEGHFLTGPEHGKVGTPRYNEVHKQFILKVREYARAVKNRPLAALPPAQPNGRLLPLLKRPILSGDLKVPPLAKLSDAFGSGTFGPIEESTPQVIDSHMLRPGYHCGSFGALNFFLMGS